MNRQDLTSALHSVGAGPDAFCRVFPDPAIQRSESMKRALYATACLAILSGCYTSQAVISDIETDKVKVQITSSAFETIDHEHESYASVVEEAQRGCDLHDRDAVEISVVTRSIPGQMGIDGQRQYEFLFACVERQEANGEGQE